MRFVIVAASMLLATSALAQDAAREEEEETAAELMPLSEIVSKVEQRENLERIEQIVRYDESIEIEYHMEDGARVTLRVDPRTGEPIQNN